MFIATEPNRISRSVGAELTAAPSIALLRSAERIGIRNHKHLAALRPRTTSNLSLMKLENYRLTATPLGESD